jgi:hypothetical protein
MKKLRRSERATNNRSSLRVMADQDWHIDSLREVLAIDTSGQSTNPGKRVIEPPYRTDNELTREH